MPELPEVAFFKKYFDTHALLRTIAVAEVKNPKIVRGITPGELEHALAGRTFLSTTQYGKYLFARLDSGGWWVVMHFGMTGHFDYFEQRELEPKYVRLLIGFEENGFLAYVNQRMLGWIGLAKDPEETIQSRGLGPAALDPDFDYASFRNRLAGRRGEVKAALMNQEITAGIGNIYSDEILFQARIHPRTRVNTLGDEQLGTIFRLIKEVLSTAVARNADTDRYPENYLLRSRRKGVPCPVCGTRLETGKVSGRTACFCPRCQVQSDE